MFCCSNEWVSTLTLNYYLSTNRSRLINILTWLALKIFTSPDWQVQAQSNGLNNTLALLWGDREQGLWVGELHRHKSWLKMLFLVKLTLVSIDRMSNKRWKCSYSFTITNTDNANINSLCRLQRTTAKHACFCQQFIAPGLNWIFYITNHRWKYPIHIIKSNNSIRILNYKVEILIPIHSPINCSSASSSCYYILICWSVDSLIP